MAQHKPKHSSLPYQYSLLSDYYKQLSIKEKLNKHYQTPKKYREASQSFETHIDYSQEPALEKIEAACQSVFCPKQTSYSKVHPKKKLRMAYDKELADAHSSTSSTSKLKDIQTIPARNASKKLYFPPDYQFQKPEKRFNFNPNDAVHHSQTKFDDMRKFQTHSLGLISINPPPFYAHSPLTPSRPNTPMFPLSSFEKGSDQQEGAEREPSNDKPQDLRVSYNERLKDVARDILTAPSIPQLNYREIPKIVSPQISLSSDESIPTAVDKYGIFNHHNKRMSGEIPPPHTPHNQSNVVPNRPKCDNSCSSCYNHFPTPSNINNQKPLQDFPPKTVKWPERESYRSSNDFDKHEKTQPPSFSHSPDKVQDPKAYLRKPIEEWNYADAIFFLVEACNELNIHTGDVKFKSSDNGADLLRMTPSDFEILAQNHGQKLYDYFISFKTEHYVASGRNIQTPSLYNNNNNNYREVHTPYSPSEQVHHSHRQHPTSADVMYPQHHYQQQQQQHESQPEVLHHYKQFQTSPYHSSCSVDSPSNEYVPQGSQYSDNHSEHRRRKSYDLPSAAWKTFPPLHNYDEPVSDPDDLEDETPPEPPKKRGPGRPPKPESERKRKSKKTGRLWEFIRNLLLDPKTCPSLLRWEDAHAGIFRIVQSDAIANKWGMRKNNEKMNYEKLSRAMRYYYKAKIFEPVLGKRLVYKFGSNAKGWRPLNPHNPNFQNY